MDVYPISHTIPRQFPPQYNFFLLGSLRVNLASYTNYDILNPPPSPKYKKQPAEVDELRLIIELLIISI